MDKAPADLLKALKAAPAARVHWDALAPIGRRDFISWIEGAKQAPTRERRIARTCDMLVQGKRRPCCYSIVPLDLHNALKATPKAKTHWSGLSPDAKRDFIGWIESAAQRDARKQRIEKACTMIASGKQSP